MIVFGSRLMLISVFGSPLPILDEWVIAAPDYVGYVNGTLRIADLFTRDNEHRIFTSRLLGLIEFEIAGEWNPRFQMAVNAAIWSGFATWLTWMLFPMVASARRWALALFSALAFALPLDGEISLFAFNSHFYLVIIFSIAAIRAFVKSAALSIGWCLGLLFTALAFFSMSSGATAPLVAAIVAALQLGVGRRQRVAREFACIVLLVSLAALLMWFTPHDGAGEQSTLATFIAALVKLASLPLATPLGVLVVHAPLVALLWTTVVHKRPMTSVEWVAIGIAGWSAAQIVAVAYYRQHSPTAPRYVDMVLILAPISFAVVATWFPKAWWSRIAAISWLFIIPAAFIIGGYLASFRMLREDAAHRAAAMVHVEDYLAGDHNALNAPIQEIPIDDKQWLIDLLSRSDYLSVLPDGIRPSNTSVRGVQARTFLKGLLAKQTATALLYLLFCAPLIVGFGLIAMIFGLLRNGSTSPPLNQTRRAAGTEDQLPLFPSSEEMR